MTSANGDWRADAAAATAVVVAAAATAIVVVATAAGNWRQGGAVVAEKAESVSASAIGGRTEGQRLETDGYGMA